VKTCFLTVVAGVWIPAAAGTAADAPVRGWLNWRGPQQNGTSLETHLPDKVSLEPGSLLWTLDMPGRGAPVIAGDRLYTWGYRGEGPDLQEVLACLDARTGKVRWEHSFRDFLSDNAYDRYSIGSPAIDPRTGNVFLLTSPGLLLAFSPDGKQLWERSLMEEFGRLTFPNGRTGAPVIDGDLVIVHGITSNWGADGPAADRFYAFETATGRLVWSSTPGIPPKDSSFSTPVLAWSHGRRVLYCGTGCGHVVCIDARTGEALWRFQVSRGGINASVLLHGDRLVAIHADENIDSSLMGGMVGFKVPQSAPAAPAGAPGPAVLDKTAELWRNRLTMFTSSPVLVGDRVLQVVATGDLCCVNAATGEVLWKHKLGPDQIHASPLYADGKLYVPMHDGGFHILRISDAGVESLCRVQLEGNCLGAPGVWNGKLYVHTTRKLYCFGRADDNPGLPPAPAPEPVPAAGPVTRLRIIPAEVLLAPGEKVTFTISATDLFGFGAQPVSAATWKKFIPPTARVRSELDAEFNPAGELVAGPKARLSAGAFEATAGALKGTIRGRILPHPPLAENFDRFELTEDHPTESGVKFAYPPLPWIGARFKWEVRDRDGSKVLAKTLDRPLFQRSITFIGKPELHGYTAEADVMSDGNRRWMSEVGLINQRYIIALKGTSQQLEVFSNYDRLKVNVPFEWEPNVWYRLKTRVDVAPDGTGVIRAKAWKRGDSEPSNWTIEVPHQNAHRHGSPGLYGFSPQNKSRVYIDNVSLTANP